MSYYHERVANCVPCALRPEHCDSHGILFKQQENLTMGQPVTGAGTVGNPPGVSFDLVGEIMAYEGDDDFTEERVIRLFQYLVDTGAAWSLQGSYGRMGVRLIEAGVVTRPA